MKKIYLKHIILFVALPIIIGGLIYILTRPDRLLMFEWFNKIGIGESIVKIRQEEDFNNFLNNWIIYNSPALIWSFSLTVLLGVIWNYKINLESINILLIPLTLGTASELCQKLGMINGTYDLIDMILYIIGGLSGIFLIGLFNKNQKIKLL